MGLADKIASKLENKFGSKETSNLTAESLGNAAIEKLQEMVPGGETAELAREAIQAAVDSANEQVVDGPVMWKGDGKTFIYRYYRENFKSGTQLIVDQSQIAVLYIEGQYVQAFGAGRHTIDTGNLPMEFGQLFRTVTGGKTVFTSNIYFVDKTFKMSIPWGVGGISYSGDPAFNGHIVKIGANGGFRLRIRHGNNEEGTEEQAAAKLIQEIVGTGKRFDTEALEDDFGGIINSKIRNIFVKTLVENNISVFDLYNYQEELSEKFKNQVAPVLSEFGLWVDAFWIDGFRLPEDDHMFKTLQRQREEIITRPGEAEIKRKENLVQQQTIADTKLIQSQADRYAREQSTMARKFEQDQLGYTMQQERQFDVMQAMAENEGGSGGDLRNAAMGLGIGFGVGGAFGNAFNNMANSALGAGADPNYPQAGYPQFPQGYPNYPPTSNAPTNAQTPAGVQPVMVPQGDQGQPVQSAQTPQTVQTAQPGDDMAAFKARLDKLNMMKEAGLLSDEEFAEQKKLLLEEIKGS